MQAHFFPVIWINHACVKVQSVEQRAFKDGFVVWLIITQVRIMITSKGSRLKELGRNVVSFNLNFFSATISFNVKFQKDSTVL